MTADTGAQAPKSAELLALAARCEAATGADQGLDAEVCHAAGYAIAPGGDGWAWWVADSYIQSIYPPKLTASLDAALALCAEKLPGWGWGGGKGEPTAKAWARVIEPYKREFYAEAVTPALALCTALLRALAQSPAEGSGT